MKIKQTIVGLAVCLALGSCGTTTNSALMKVHKGMAQSEVKRVLGTPDYRRFNPEGEQWEYLNENLLTGRNTVVVVDFVDGRVVNLDSFNARLPVPVAEVCPPVVEVVEPAPAPYVERPHREGALLPRRRAMQPEDFDRLYNKVKQKDFRDEQLELLSVGVADRYFSCSQCARLLSIFTWDDDRIKALNMMIDRLVDRENGEQIARTFDSMFKRDEVRKRLGLPTGW